MQVLINTHSIFKICEYF